MRPQVWNFSICTQRPQASAPWKNSEKIKIFLIFVSQNYFPITFHSVTKKFFNSSKGAQKYEEKEELRYPVPSAG